MTLRGAHRFIYFTLTLVEAATSSATATSPWRNSRIRSSRVGAGQVAHATGTARCCAAHLVHETRSVGVKKTIRFRGGGLGSDDRKSSTSSQREYSGRATWIQNFCRTPGNEFFAQVPESFIRENMNLVDIGRGVEIPYYKEALGMLLGATRVSSSIHGDAGQKSSAIHSSAALLYGLLHARYLVSPHGLKVVLEKYSKADYGRCPRVYCQGQAVLPVGETDRPMQSSVRVFCPRCGDLFYPSRYVRASDGAFWGTTLPHLLLLGWPELKTTPNVQQYVPRIYGFKIHAKAPENGLEHTPQHNAGRGTGSDEKGAAGA